MKEERYYKNLSSKNHYSKKYSEGKCSASSQKAVAVRKDSKKEFIHQKRKKNPWKYAFAILAFVFLLSIVGGLFNDFVSPKVSVVEANQQLSEIKYKVIQIQKGDSLWSIASDNMNPGFSNIHSYIHEIKKCNQLDSDRIISGNYLMIPYYEDLSINTMASN